MEFRIEKNELMFAIFLAVCGFLISWHPVVDYFNSNSPIFGLLIKYVFLCVVVGFVLKLFGLRVGGLKIDGSLTNVIGSVMIIFAFLIVVNFVNSPLAQIYADGDNPAVHADHLSNMLLISEDAAAWFTFKSLGVQSVDMLRLLTYVFTPLVLSLLGGLLLSKRSFKQAIGMVG